MARLFPMRVWSNVCDSAAGFPQKEAKRYWRIKHGLLAADIVLTFVLLAAVLFLDISSGLRNWSMELVANPYGYIALYLICLGFAFYAISFPLDFYGGFVLERKFSLTNLPFRRWLRRHLKSVMVSAVIGLPLIELVYFFLRRFEQSWWILAALLWAGFTIILGNLAPVIIIPLFYKYKTLQDRELKKRLMNLANKTGAKVRGVFEINMSRYTRKANAGLTGFGNTRRIILGDNLLSGYSADEIEIILAHELGHHKGAHLWKSVACEGITVFLGLFIANLVLKASIGRLGFSGMADIGAFPLLCMVLYGFSLLMMPLQNGFSRYMEREADRFALEVSQTPSAFISGMNKLAQQNLSDPCPGLFVETVLYNHPPISKRIKMAQEYMRDVCGTKS